MTLSSLFASAWDVVVFMFWIFVFITYLTALFSVIGDLIRDKQTNGWIKALWFVLLIFVPLLTVLVYLIFRGRGMTKRQIAAAEEARKATEEYVRNAAGHSSADEIAKAKSLLDAGTITAAEYEALKAKALAS
ncbi:SHOCT domain-containing protein [Lysinibacter cavernae]|uniref:Uncharacterized protein YqhQ n=1 Tax=Lysinibacter cavernae TaxID=1640652 RepID=A0A7X5TST3_9MICO|nr:SHOCT domain-containing protein [Lysinibacter cavernae]NIH52568.1 uncharacterized protein YqhQ [Lysinibacter cavernae]